VDIPETPYFISGSYLCWGTKSGYWQGRRAPWKHTLEGEQITSPTKGL
jgi:hypothetical protein